MEGRSAGRGTGRRVTMREAAEVLGVSVEAIRKRVQRGTIPSEKGEDGRRYVYLDTGRDDASPDPAGEADPSRELVEVLRAQIEDLRGRLDREQEANRDNRRIIGALTSRIPELEAPRREEPRESPLRAEEEPPTSTPQEDQGGPEGGVERPESQSWWRRLFR